ncbi:MAG: hypothetical protein M0R46_11475 [Candidatus Muirbacterium halophilum]|nr:hypothetical protein [Candidatus Muirbacterium halophilum]
MKKKCRVFTTCLGWSEVMFIFDEETKFSEIKNKPQTHMLTRDDYVGTYEFDKKFIQLFNRSKIGDKYYFYRFSYHKDDKPQEEQQWIKIPEFVPKEEPKQQEYTSVKKEEGQSNAEDFQSLFD